MLKDLFFKKDRMEVVLMLRYTHKIPDMSQKPDH